MAEVTYRVVPQKGGRYRVEVVGLPGEIPHIIADFATEVEAQLWIVDELQSKQRSSTLTNLFGLLG
jgi:hypothetical protein